MTEALTQAGSKLVISKTEITALKEVIPGSFSSQDLSVLSDEDQDAALTAITAHTLQGLKMIFSGGE